MDDKTPDDWRGKPVSKQEIEKLNQQRPKPALTLDLTPTGPDWEQAKAEAAQEKNTQVDNRIAYIRKRLQRRKGQAKGQFRQAAENAKDFGLGS